MIPESVIPKGSTVLLTGANGYIASHIADQLISAGYKVKGTVRNEEKGSLIAEALEKRHDTKGAFSYVVVEEMSAENAFDDAIKDCSAVAHAATDMSFRDDPNVVIPLVVSGVRNALKAAASTPSVKRFVLTSSSNCLFQAVADTKYHLDSNSWNDISPKEAWKTEGFDPAARPMHIYSASKIAAERAAWEFMQKEKPNFELNTICPNFSIGEVIDKRLVSSSAAVVKGLYGGYPPVIGFIQNSPPQFSVDVKDAARLHVAALTMTDVKGERLLALNDAFNYSRLCESLKKADPSKEFPPPVENEGKCLGTLDMKRSVELLKRMGFEDLTPMDESMKQLLATAL